MSKYGSFDYLASSGTSELVRKYRSASAAGGGSIVLERGSFSIWEDTLGEPDDRVALYLGEGATLDVGDGLSPDVRLTLPFSYVEAVPQDRRSPFADRRLRWSSERPPMGLYDRPQGSKQAWDLELQVPENLLARYEYSLQAPRNFPRARVSIWGGYPHTTATEPAYSVPESDVVGAPEHYTWLGSALSALGLADVGNVEAWDVLDAAFPSNPHLWNCGKYLLRQGRKGGEEKRLEDLRKARQYLDRAIEALEAGKNV